MIKTIHYYLFYVFNSYWWKLKTERIVDEKCIILRDLNEFYRIFELKRLLKKCVLQ